MKYFYSSPAWYLFGSSFLALFAELLLIRWLPLQIRLLAYYSNLILLSSLLGFGIGLILASRRRYRILQWTPFFLAVLVGLVVFIANSPLVLPLASEDNFIWSGLSRAENSFGPLSYAVLVSIFLLNTIFFVFLAHELGYWFAKLPPLQAYSLDLLGSISGVAVFTLVSAYSMPPVFWFFLFGAFFLFHAILTRLITHRGLFIGTAAFIGVLLLVFLASASRDEEFFWSPYYEIQTKDIQIENRKVGVNVLVNKDSHQQMLDLSGDIEHPFIESRKVFYDLPYQFFPEAPSRVLVLGAGTGNDVAAGLRNGARSIDAVEIDPVIANIGKEHPEQPYADLRVRIIVDDARAFLERNKDTYDFIAFGFLDSHRLFSSMASVRLDNYLYTVENMNNVKEHLTEGGIVAVAYTVHEQWIADRIFHLLRSTFEQTPLVYQGNKRAWGTIFFARNGAPLLQPEALIQKAEFEETILPASQGHTWAYAEKDGFLSPEIFSLQASLPTDDWPHLFMRERGIPGNYIAILLIIFSFSFVLVRFQIPKLAFQKMSSWNFFFLGAGFALLETKGIIELALVLGSTWITNAVVITGILLMILLANLLVLKRFALPYAVLYGALVALLLFSFFFSLNHLFQLAYSWRLFFAGIQVGLPIFFAGILFSRYLAKTDDAPTALGANLLGAMVGGLFEYTSLLSGQRVLFLAAIVFYLCSLFFAVWEERRKKVPAEI